mmetsp:Transcript_24117/g.51128  ORF Transcript_24117/g.51128 Transcript_24117/m.51128 type:complete len:213 (-) Transcript_24117:131-769(-)
MLARSDSYICSGLASFGCPFLWTQTFSPLPIDCSQSLTCAKVGSRNNWRRIKDYHVLASLFSEPNTRCTLTKAHVFPNSSGPEDSLPLNTDWSIPSNGSVFSTLRSNPFHAAGLVGLVNASTRTSGQGFDFPLKIGTFRKYFTSPAIKCSIFRSALVCSNAFAASSELALAISDVIVHGPTVILLSVPYPRNKDLLLYWPFFRPLPKGKLLG